MSLHYEYQIKDYAQQELFCFLYEIEILSKEWDWNPGDIVEVPVLATDELKAEDLVCENFQGSEFPSWTVKSSRKIPGAIMFSMQIQRSVLQDIYNLGRSKKKKVCE